jgi:hypothetical protein
MKKVTCRSCGEPRPSIIAFEGCKCGCPEITFGMGVVADLLNSRESATLNCPDCNTDLFGLDVDAYLHENGWRIPGLKHSWWLSVVCPKCQREASFTNFGITG